MPKLIDWCDEASVCHWEGEAATDWDEIYAHMAEHGRSSRVRHPTPAPSGAAVLAAETLGPRTKDSAAHVTAGTAVWRQGAHIRFVQLGQSPSAGVDRIGRRG